MDSRKYVYQETAIIVGEIICVAVMFAVFLLLDRFDQTVLLGGILGAVVSILNFFFMAVCANLAADKAEAQNVKGGQAIIRFSFLIRQVVMWIILFAALKSKLFNIIALLLPLVFTRPILTVGEFFRKSGEKKV